MQFSYMISTLVMAVYLGSVAQAMPASPRPCPQYKVDAILKGEMPPEECCSYGQCKGDVVVSVG